MFSLGTKYYFTKAFTSAKPPQNNAAINIFTESNGIVCIRMFVRGFKKDCLTASQNQRLGYHFCDFCQKYE